MAVAPSNRGARGKPLGFEPRIPARSPSGFAEGRATTLLGDPSRTPAFRSGRILRCGKISVLDSFGSSASSFDAFIRVLIVWPRF